MGIGWVEVNRPQSSEINMSVEPLARCRWCKKGPLMTHEEMRAHKIKKHPKEFLVMMLRSKAKMSERAKAREAAKKAI